MPHLMRQNASFNIDNKARLSPWRAGVIPTAMSLLKNIRQHLHEVPLADMTQCPKCGKESKWLSAHLILKHAMSVRAAGHVVHPEHRAAARHG
jgi:hypothetical protein